MNLYYYSLVEQPAAVSLIPSRAGPLYAGTSYGITYFVSIDRTAVDIPVQADIQFIPINTAYSSGDLMQVNTTTFAKNIIYDVLTTTMYKVIPTSIIIIFPASPNFFVYSSHPFIKLISLRQMIY